MLIQNIKVLLTVCVSVTDTDPYQQSHAALSPQKTSTYKIIYKDLNEMSVSFKVHSVCTRHTGQGVIALG